MLLDITSLTAGVDASALLQQAIDSGAVELPPCVLTLSRPVYLSNDAELTGSGRRSVLQPSDTNYGWDVLVALPPAVRHYDPTLHLSPNAVDPARHAFRTTGSAGMRFHNTVADIGWPGADHWAAVRQFAVEFTAERHGGRGGVCGMAWGGAGQFRPAPWYVSQHPDWAEWLDFSIATADGSTVVRRFRVGAAGETAKFRFVVDLDAGVIGCEVDGIELTGGDVLEIGFLEPGATLVDNPGAPLWVGGLSTMFAGRPAPELGCADVTFHTFRLWRTATPPASGYDPFGWYPGTAFVLPLSAAPHTGDPAVAFTGEHTGFGYLVPLEDAGDLWSKGVRVSDVALRGGRYGAGISVASCLDVAVDRVHTDGFAVGLQVLGGPLPSYPVRVRDLTAVRPTDAAVRLQWTLARLDGLTAHYPARSVLRADSCGMLSVSDVFHAGENAGAGNTVTDVFRFDHCNTVKLDGILSNYEDGFGPRRAYVCFTGKSGEPSQPQILRILDFGRGQSLRPGAKYLDTTGSGPLSADVRDSF